jgi:hypothetical protein
MQPSDFNDEQVKQIAALEQTLPKELHGLLANREGASIFLEVLRKYFRPSVVAMPGPEQRAWEQVGNFYRGQGRLYEAIAVYGALYNHMLLSQVESGKRCHKGMPVVWMSDCYRNLGCPLISLRFLMLALIEDAIVNKGEIPSGWGVYFRAVWFGGLPDSDVRRYTREAWEFTEKHSDEALFPERILLELDQEWTRPPSILEIGVFPSNALYIRWLIDKLGDGSGTTLELLARYVLSAMPGCRASRRGQSGTHEYDVVCSMEGLDLDFRSELGRYFVGECKDWDKPADVRTMAVLCRVLDSIKSHFGILFSRSGISGGGEGKYAELEQIKIFQDRGTVIVVIDKDDLEQLAGGANFVSLLRRKYERVRLNLISAPA